MLIFPTQQQCLNTPVHPGPEPKPLLKLPSSQQEWAEANTFFSEVLVAEVLRESTPESMNGVLCEGIYSFFVQKYGTRKPRIPKQQQTRERHERALKKVKQLKKEASLYKAGICPRLSWLLTIEELPITWVERQLEVLATRYLKKWAGLAKSASTALLYLPQKKGGMNLPSLTSLYKRLQVSHQSQLLMSQDPCVRYLAEKGLQHDSTKKFKASVVVRDALAKDPN